MAPRTVDEIEDLLDSSFAWRRVELQALGAAIADAERSSPNTPLTRALARSGVALLYAHWEGFFKDACQAYVDYVAKRRLLYSELNDGFLRTVMMALGKRAATGDEAGLAVLFESIREPEKSRARIPKNTIVDTKSNLRYVVLVEIMRAIGFPYDHFATKNNLIDKTLCDGRNSIAHGRDYFPASGSFVDLHAEVLEMMEDLRSVIMSNVRTEQYKRSSSGK
ncbi:MAE_28990/MAE_18760 family HEPN-like nuclease [Nonomuraea sp. MTCD27]|uniref:MAE_28990/MAE_18760 family HEPN-like nuclease n=1 Tax=Nonomuraea sp. MTCD27 TaxID=1676747 RepID=UPI0035C20467